MKKLGPLILICLMSLAIPLGAAPLKVGVCLQPPLTIRGENGQPPQGFFTDILEAIAAQNGWSLSYTVDSRANLMNKLAQQEIDLLVPSAFPMNGADILDHTAGLVSSYGALYVPANTLAPAFQDLAGKTIALARDDVYSQRFQEFLKSIGIRCQFIVMPSYEEVFAAIEAGQVDAGLADHLFGDQHRKQYNLAASPTAIAPTEFHFAVYHERNWAIRQTLDREILSLKLHPDSIYYTALSRWTGYHKPLSGIAFSGFIVLGILGAVGLLILLILPINRFVKKQTDKLGGANRQLLKTVEDHLRNEAAAENLKIWYQTLLNNTPDCILIHGVDPKGMAGKFLEVNTTTCTRFGYTRQELLSLTPQNIEVTPDNAASPRYSKLLSKWKNARLPDATDHDKKAEALIVELSYRTKNGSYFPAEVLIRILEYNGQPVIFYDLHDITNRQKAKQELLEKEQRFADFFARAPFGVALFDPSQKLTEVNHAALAMYGFSERSQFAEARVFNIGELEPELVATLMKGGTVRFESVIDFDEIRKEKRYASARTGKCFFDILITNLGLDSNFNPKGFMLQMQDISERRRAEDALRQNEKVLRQAQKMEAIGTLAGGIAHDFNNILTPIIGYTEMAMMTAPPGDPIQTSLDEVLKASHRAKDLVKQILTFSRQTEHEVKPIRLIPLVKEVIQLLRGAILPTIELHTHVQTERDIIKADPTQMHQVIMNLCTNATHAMKEKGGILEIGIRQVVVDSHTHGQLARLRYGAYVEITVRDSGHGMDRSVLDRIFEPFFTTKRSGEGTGMGLAVVHGIIASLHGAITVESEVGKGTTFHVVLPLMEQAADLGDAKAVSIPRGSERILYVDDESGIVNMVSQMLTSLGYKMETTTKPAEGITLFKEDPSRFDLIITDQIMPGITGIELIHEIHVIRPDIPALLCTGFSKTVTDADLVKEGVREVIMKPIILLHLAEAIRRTLERPSTPDTPTV